MENPEDKFKINLNQNLWGLVLGLGSLGLSEYFKLGFLFCFSVVLTFVALVSVAFTTSAYTINYCRQKLGAKKHQPKD